MWVIGTQTCYSLEWPVVKWPCYVLSHSLLIVVSLFEGRCTLPHSAAGVTHNVPQLLGCLGLFWGALLKPRALFTHMSQFIHSFKLPFNQPSFNCCSRMVNTPRRGLRVFVIQFFFTNSPLIIKLFCI